MIAKSARRGQAQSSARHIPSPSPVRREPVPRRISVETIELGRLDAPWDIEVWRDGIPTPGEEEVAGVVVDHDDGAIRIDARIHPARALEWVFASFRRRRWFRLEDRAT